MQHTFSAGLPPAPDNCLEMPSQSYPGVSLISQVPFNPLNLTEEVNHRVASEAVREADCQSGEGSIKRPIELVFLLLR